MSLLKDKNRLILGFEAVLFAGVFGIAFHSWMLFIVLIGGLLAILSRKNGLVYGMVVLSGLWGFVAFSIGYEISLSWALKLGVCFLLLGLAMHAQGLRKPLGESMVPVHDNVPSWQRYRYDGGLNLN